MRKGLFATLEDETGLAQVVADQGPVVPEVVAEVAEGSAELSQDAQEVGDLVAQVEDAQLADQELQQVADTMQQSIDEGTGLDTGAAQMAEIATESIMNRLGLKGQRVIPATESFGSSNSRVAATRIAMEGVVDTIKKIWEGIKNFLKMVWQKITDFFAKFFSNTDKLEKAAKALQDKVGGLGSKAPKEKKIDNSSIAAAFKYNGKVNKDSVAAILGNHGAAVKGVNGLYTGALGLVNIVGGVLDEKKADEAQVTKLFDSVEKLIESSQLSTKPEAKKTENGKDGEKLVVKHGPFVDGRYFVLEMTSKDKTELTSVSFTIDDAEKEAKATEVQVLTVEEMHIVCNFVIDLAKETGEYKKFQPNIMKFGTEVTKIVDGVIGAATVISDSVDNNHEFRRQLSVAKAAITGVSNVVSRSAVMLPAANVRAGNKALAYVQASMKQYEAKAEDKK